jgi:predicted metal-dependent hydrolase
VSAHRQGDTVVVSIPARFTKAQEREWVDKMVHRLATKQSRRKPSDEALIARSHTLSAQYLGGKAVPSSVRWASNQERRWGSCTVEDRSIRISARLQGMPQYVVDYVLLHELAHLLHAGHGPQFWQHLQSYPHLNKARGFLEGVVYGRESGADGEDPVDDGFAGDAR